MLSICLLILCLLPSQPVLPIFLTFFRFFKNAHFIVCFHMLLVTSCLFGPSWKEAKTAFLGAVYEFTIKSLIQLLSVFINDIATTVSTCVRTLKLECLASIVWA